MVSCHIYGSLPKKVFSVIFSRSWTLWIWLPYWEKIFFTPIFAFFENKLQMWLSLDWNFWRNLCPTSSRTDHLLHHPSSNKIKCSLLPELFELSSFHLFQFKLSLPSLFVQLDTFFKVLASFADAFSFLLSDLSSNFIGKLWSFLLRFQLFVFLSFNQFLLSSVNRIKSTINTAPPILNTRRHNWSCPDKLN